MHCVRSLPGLGLPGVDYRAQSEASASTADTAGIRVAPPLYYVGGFLAGVVLELVFPTSWPSSGVRLAAALIAGGAWLVFDIGAMVFFRRAGTSPLPMNPTTDLVTSGPYRVTRNPMYVGMAFLYVALAFAFGVTWALVLLPGVIAMIDRFVIAREEPYLERKFGQPYRDYKARVRRWI
jgi:protein-S-isoprenylcysteine O-methyltransferase Ste14